MTVSAVNTNTNENGVTWYELSGDDQGTGCSFTNDIVGVTDDNRVLDCDGIPCTEGDSYTIAVRSSLGIS